MFSRSTLILILFVAAVHTRAVQPDTVPTPEPPTRTAREGFRVYEDSVCGFSVEHPKSWLAEPSSSETYALGYEGPRLPATCAAGIQPSDWQFIRSTSAWKRRRYVVTVVVLEAGLRDAATGTGFARVADLRATSLPDFQPSLKPDDWVHGYYQGDIQAEWVRTPCCRGLRAYFGAKSGPDYPSTNGKKVVLNNHHGRSAVIETEEREYEGVFDAIVESFRFRDSRPSEPGVIQPSQPAP